VEVVVAVTDTKPLGSVGGAVLLAALALPGLCPTQAHAENPPERATFEFKYLYYKDKQPGQDRIKVSAPAVSFEAPLGSQWSVAASAVNDSVSGASPRTYTYIPSGASMHDNRTAFDGSVTYYRPLSAYSFSLSRSKEHDYISEAGGVNARFASDDHNTTVNVGMGLSSDTITSRYTPSLHGRKHTNEYIIGVTQALSRTDLVQANVGFSVGRGDFSDSYKGDSRPDRREQLTQLIRWNHHFEGLGATMRSSYRHYTDNWDLRSHTFQIDWVQPVNDQFSLTPSVRYYTQNAAWFYVDPVPGTSTMPDEVGDYFATDQRLAAFGELSLALRADYEFNKDWSTNLRGEWLEQRGVWRAGGKGSPGLANFSAVSVQWGLKRAF
jgi:hypothetical protein